MDADATRARLHERLFTLVEPLTDDERMELVFSFLRQNWCMGRGRRYRAEWDICHCQNDE